MNLQQLSVFREVMKTGSVSAAARNLHRTQPAISASLKALETSLGVALFHREGRRLTPVPEAHYLLAEATEILDRMAMTASNLSELRNRARGTIKVAAMPGTSAFLMPDFVSRFIAEKPGVQVTLATRSSPQILSMIAAQSYDVGFCDVKVDTARRDLFEAVHLRRNCVVAVRNDHRLAGKPQINAADLDDEPMGTLHTGHRVYEDTERAFVRAGARFNVRVQAQYFLPLFHFIEAGQICAVVDAMSAESHQRMHGVKGNIHFANFSPEVAFGYSIVTPQQRPPSALAQEFVESWERYVRELIDAKPSNEGAK
ncbi:LysR family transcriptional regulator [Roseovarius albus]|nr:LysR family transcriptional regulator [Roseovarius albus]